LQKYQKEIETQLISFEESNIVQRLFDHDHTIWSDSPDEISNRLGWLDSPSEMLGNIEDINSFVSTCKKEGFQKVLLLGMGGSSLAPELFNEVFNKSEKGLELRIADSTHPDRVAELRGYFSPEQTLYIVSTKSGGTVETISLMNFFYNQCSESLGPENAGSRFASITDPGSKLEEISSDLGFRKCFLNNPNIGGRFSVLSYFGLVPAALVGIDIQQFLNKVIKFKNQLISKQINLSSLNNPVRLGAIIGSLADNGLDKLTFVISAELINFGDWLEQLIAESSGKEGKGILPVIEKQTKDLSSYSLDRVFVCISLGNYKNILAKSDKIQDAGLPLITINLEDKTQLGTEFYRWEIITAIACAVLNVNPFDQPNVESTKVIARRFLAEYKEKGEIAEPEYMQVENGLTICSDTNYSTLSEAISGLIANGNKIKNKYISIQAYISQSSQNIEKLEEIKNALQNKTGIPITIGFGPRFLHSTGQLHKGDGGNGLFLQIVSDPADDIDIPDSAGDNKSSLSFGTLIKAQYLGDRSALIDAERKVLTINIGNNITEGLNSIINSIGR
jgi:glucose-6-phosphate isomerase